MFKVCSESPVPDFHINTCCEQGQASCDICFTNCPLWELHSHLQSLREEVCDPGDPNSVREESARGKRGMWFCHFCKMSWMSWLMTWPLSYKIQPKLNTALAQLVTSAMLWPFLITWILFSWNGCIKRKFNVSIFLTRSSLWCRQPTQVSAF